MSHTSFSGGLPSPKIGRESLLLQSRPSLLSSATWAQGSPVTRRIHASVKYPGDLDHCVKELPLDRSVNSP